MKIPFKALKRLGACQEATEWLQSQDDCWQTSWDACVRGDWMTWLLYFTEEKQPWGSSRHRAWYGAKAEILIANARPFSTEITDEAIDRMIELLTRYEEGGEITREELTAWAAEAAEAARAAWAARAAGAAWAAWAAGAAWAAEAAGAAGAAEAAEAAGAAEAAWAAWAESLSSSADILRSRYPTPPLL